MLSLGLLKSGRKMSEIFPRFAFDPFVFVNPRVASREVVRQAVGDERVKAAVKAAEEKSSLLKNVEENESLKIFTQDFPKRMLAEFKDCSLFYGERKICGPVVLHPSGTEPLIRVWVSGSDEALVRELSDSIVNEIKRFQ